MVLTTKKDLYQMNLLLEDPDNKYERSITKDRLPTNTTSNFHPVHRWFNFIAGYSPEFVYQCCKDANLSRSSTLLDPFAGCATSLVVAKSIGLQSFGYEAHPIFARIGNAKVNSPFTIEHISKIERCIFSGIANPIPLDVLPSAPHDFLRKLFPEDILEQLLGARNFLLSSELADDDLAFLVLSKVVDLSSHSQTDGIYKAPTSRKQGFPPSEALARVIDEIRQDVFTAPCVFNETVSRLFHHTSENMEEISNESVSIIITSPPYLNNFDYAEMTRMYLYFWGFADSWGDITDKVRSKLIVNTTTALKGHKDKQGYYRDNTPDILHSEIDFIISQLKNERSLRAGKKEYDFIIYPYLYQMTKIFRECFRCLKQLGRIHIMVADAALYGVHISTPQMLASILEEIGFQDVRCDFVRRRGHRWVLSKRDGSKQGLGEYHVYAVK